MDLVRREGEEREAEVRETRGEREEEEERGDGLLPD